MQITIPSTTLANYNGSGTTATLKILADQDFRTSDGANIARNYVRDGVFYDTVNCTVSGGVVTIPSYTLDSTTDSSVPGGTYTAILYDANGKRVQAFYSGWRIPTVFGDTPTWVQLSTYNGIVPTPFTLSYPTIEQVQALIDTANVGNGSNVIETVISSLSDLTTLISTANANTSNTYDAVMDSSVTVSSAKTIPSNVYIKSLNGSKFVKSGTGALTFQGIGLRDTESKIAIFSGFSSGDITWTGAASLRPSAISTELWDTGNSSLTDRLERADRAFTDYVRIVCHPRTITGSVDLSQKRDIYFMPGDYPNTNPGPYAPFQLNSYTYFHGPRTARLFEGVGGSGTTRIVGPHNSDFTSQFDEIVVEGLTFMGDPAATPDGTNTTVILGNVHRGGIRNCLFYSTKAYGAYLGGFGAGGYWAQDSDISDNVFIKVGTQVTGIINGKNCRISRNHLNQQNSPETFTYAAIDLEPNAAGDFLEDIIVEDNTVDCRDINDGSKYVSGIFVQCGETTAVRNVTIRNNTIYGPNLTNGGVDEQYGFMVIGISLGGTEEAYIHNNTVRGSGQIPIQIAGCRDTRIYDNDIILGYDILGNYTQMAINYCNSCDIVNNRVNETTLFASNTQKAGIYEGDYWVPFSSSGSTITCLYGTNGSNFLVYDHFTGLPIQIAQTTYTFNTRTDSTHFTLTSPPPALSTKTITSVDAATDIFTVTSHGFTTGQAVYLLNSGGATPAHTLPTLDYITGKYIYFVINQGTNTLKLANSYANALAGTAINFTDTGSGTNTLVPVFRTKFSNNKYENNKHPDGIVLTTDGSSEIVSTYHDKQITNVADVDHSATLAEGIIVYTSLTADRTVTLPYANICKGKEFIVKDGCGGAATKFLIVSAQSSDRIQGNAFVAISTGYGSLKVKSDGTGWIVL